jgi:pimeloyl-ACP methyl ester carboxylesterase
MTKIPFFAFMAGWIIADPFIIWLLPWRPAPCQVVALDLPGHGTSSHKSNDAPPMVQAELSYYVSEAIDALGLLSSEKNSLTLCGHSLGAGISSLYAAAFPERVSKLVLLDGAGFLAREAKDTALHVRRHVESRQKFQTRDATRTKSPRIYPSLERAIQTRRLSASRMPGKQSISHEAARALVERGTVALPNNDGVQFRHDPRFAWPSIQYMTRAQSEGIFQDVQADVCLLVAEQGYPFKTDDMERAKELLRPRLFETLPGGHYFHADPDTAGAVAETISEFLSETED